MGLDLLDGDSAGTVHQAMRPVAQEQRTPLAPSGVRKQIAAPRKPRHYVDVSGRRRSSTSHVRTTWLSAVLLVVRFELHGKIGTEITDRL